MARLSLAGLSRDRSRLLLVDAAGSEFSLEVDNRLRAALRGESGPGQMESTMDSALRPRDIQARIRAGESAEDVAAAAGTDVERIMTYAGPVLAEREHMAVRAQSSSVRRRVGDSGARTLGQAVEQQMHAAEADHEGIEWDAWQREDRRWVLIASYESAERAGIAEFVFDPRGNYVTTTNDDAKWLVGEPLPVEPPARDDLHEARERRLSTPVEPAAPADTAGTAESVAPLEAPLPPRPSESGASSWAEQPRHDEAPAGPVDTADEDETIDLGETAARIRDMVAADEAAARSAHLTHQSNDQSTDEPSARVEHVEAPAPQVAEPTGPAESEQLTLDEVPEAPEPPKRKKSRRSVPSWDEIMFGGGPAKD